MDALSGQLFYSTQIPGFCKSAMLDELRKHGRAPTPGRYVGAETGCRDRCQPE